MREGKPQSISREKKYQRIMIYKKLRQASDREFEEKPPFLFKHMPRRLDLPIFGRMYRHFKIPLKRPFPCQIDTNVSPLTGIEMESDVTKSLVKSILP